MELFRTTLDPKGSGEVSGEDLKHVLSSLGQNLSAEELGVMEGEQVLLGVFSPATQMSSQPQGRSGLCVYSLQHVDTLFDQVCPLPSPH